MPRPKIDRQPIYKMFALNWDKKKIKKEANISERTFFMLKGEYDVLPIEEKERVKVEALQEEKAKERFEDHEFVQKWIQKMQSGIKPIKSWQDRVNKCRRIWLLLDKKDPQNWTIEDLESRVLPKLRETMKSVFHYLIAIRSLRPDLKTEIPTKGEKGAINVEWKYAYKQIVQDKLVNAFFESARLPFKVLNNPTLEHEAETIVRTHVVLGCREGSRGEGGILNLEWEKLDWNNKSIDIYETKTGGGFYWLDCPLDLFGDKTVEMLREWHKYCGEPKRGKIFPNLRYYTIRKKKGKQAYTSEIEETTKLPYIGLVEIYDYIGKAIKLSIELKPHFARKLHASLLRHSGVPLEIVAGEPPHGIVGVGWEDLTTLKKFYVSFAEEDIRKAKEKAKVLQI